jgi:hypothetical protein
VRLSGSRLERAAALAIDDTGAVSLTGDTDSPDFPLLNALQTTVLPGSDGFDRSAFVSSLMDLAEWSSRPGWRGAARTWGRVF